MILDAKEQWYTLENLEKVEHLQLLPIDADAIIKAAAETGAIVTAEEHNIIGGLGSAVSEVVVANKPVPMEFVGVRDTFGESGTPKELMAKYGLTAKDIVEAVKRVITRK